MNVLSSVLELYGVRESSWNVLVSDIKTLSQVPVLASKTVRMTWCLKNLPQQLPTNCTLQLNTEITQQHSLISLRHDGCSSTPMIPPSTTCRASSRRLTPPTASGDSPHQWDMVDVSSVNYQGTVKVQLSFTFHHVSLFSHKRASCQMHNNYTRLRQCSIQCGPRENHAHSVDMKITRE